MSKQFKSLIAGVPGKYTAGKTEKKEKNSDSMHAISLCVAAFLIA